MISVQYMIDKLRAYQEFKGWGPIGKGEYEHPAICEEAASILHQQEERTAELTTQVALGDSSMRAAEARVKVLEEFLEQYEPFEGREPIGRLLKALKSEGET